MRAKRYCESCGLLMLKQVAPLNSYDTFTGHRNSKVTLRCPNYRWFRLGHWPIGITNEYERDDENG